MPKIEVSAATRPDKAVARERAISDLMYIESSNMYINQKKQLQALVKILYDMDYYIDNDTFLKYN